jgi:dTDP-4-dehydrorhamnose 3,5-epimerase
MIKGVTVAARRRIADDRGAVFHMLKNTDPEFKTFGEIYFSYIYPGIVKAWHGHKKMDLNYVCISGMVKIVLYDGRRQSPTFKELQEIYIGEQDYQLVHIPHGVVNGIMGLGTKPAIVANCATIPHDPAEMTRLDPATADIPYEWHVKPR